MLISEVREVTQYDGTNASAILAIIAEDPTTDTWEFFQETEAGLTLKQTNEMGQIQYHTIGVGWWVFHWNLVENTWLWWMPDDVKQAKYRELPAE